jgi:hypothetical protein
MFAPRSFRVWGTAGLFLAGLLLIGQAEVFGQGKKKKDPAKAAKAAAKAAEKKAAHQFNANVVAELRKAHALLHKGLHDYKGHRVKAVGQINQAIKELHVHHKGGKKPGPVAKAPAGKKVPRLPQAQSDALLKQAEQILHAAHKQLIAAKVGYGRRKAAKHVKHAVEQLQKALKVA